MAEDDGRALLSVVVERLGDLFEPRLCVVYERLFREVIARACPELVPRLRSPGSSTAPAAAKRVYVLSRITLGADVAVTSVVLDAAKKRYPDAEIVFVGPRKSYEMFEADSRVAHKEAPYARSGSLIDRLRASDSLYFDDGIVIDPDSRLTQLGLISVCDEDRYFFFNSRAYGEDGEDRLPVLASRWARETLGAEDARAYVAPLASSEAQADITVSLGVGQNQSKRIDGAFETELLAALAETGASVLVDKGGSPEERERVERAVLPGMRTHDGAFAPFAAQIAGSKLYVGYDSAGQHVASAAGVPLVTIFRGFVNERFLARWRPEGTVIRGDVPDVLDQVRAAITYTFRR
jgi:Glycosyltransferase family 9 (heptosyltransferase)